MKKDITICFRTSTQIRGSLEKIAEEERKTVSSVIETILYNALKEKKALPAIGKEKRKHARKKLAIPALINEIGAETKEFSQGTILDISLGGVRIAIPRGAKCEISTDNETYELNIVFALPYESRPVNVKCRPQRIADAAEGNLQVGASFVDSDFQSYQTLQRYLI
jgi:hypothetical protein